MAKKRRAKKPRFSEAYAEAPSGDAAAARWKEFMQRLDDLNEHCCEISAMGETLIQALEEAAETTGNPLLGLIQRVAAGFSEARRQYGEQR